MNLPNLLKRGLPLALAVWGAIALLAMAAYFTNNFAWWSYSSYRFYEACREQGGAPVIEPPLRVCFAVSGAISVRE